MTNIILFYFTSLLLTSCMNGTFSSPDHEEKSHASEYQLIWQDEFQYEGLPDPAKWDYDTEGNEDGWGNKEAQFYTKSRLENAHVKNGKLSIIARKEPFRGKEYSSARLVSKADWMYGKIEVRAKLPSARGTWSAIWMMPGGWTFKDGNWPDIGEIDIMEHVGHDLGTIHASAHSKDYQWQKNTQKTAIISVPDVHENFHSYILEWTPDSMKAFVDDSLFFVYANEGLGESKWPYDKPFYLILNIAVGGAWGSVEGVDESAFPQSMEVDYVRVYQRKEEID